MTGFVSTVGDDLRHARYVGDVARPFAERFTVCGKRIAGTLADGPACHICLPAEAHPMAEVWAMCRRYDDRFNAGAGEPR